MAIKLSAVQVSVHELTKTDKAFQNEGEPTTVTIRQARTGEQQTRQTLFSRIERRMNDTAPDEITLVQNISMAAVYELEAWLTLVGSNIIGPDNTPMFPSRKNQQGQDVLACTRAEFKTAWDTLPASIAMEITEKIHEVNPQWSLGG